MTGRDVWTRAPGMRESVLNNGGRRSLLSLANFPFGGAHYGLKSDIVQGPKSAATNGLTPTFLPWERMLKEETQHFPCCVRCSRIGVGACRAAPRPCVGGAMDVPVLKDCAPARFGKDGAGSRTVVQEVD
jgi:hypothetical protein